MKKLSLMFLVFMFTFSACNKDEEFVKAKIVNESYILSGCGWLVEINSALYAPQNLSDAYKVGGMFVEIKYDKLATKIACQLHQDGIYEIYINEIR
jgi:hypothetical protein